MTDIELLPLHYDELPEVPEDIVMRMQAYARANVARAVEPLQAEVEALRAEVERVACELMDAITRADKLAEALRELVDVFSKSGMYDEEVFAKARAELEQEERK